MTDLRAGYIASAIVAVLIVLGVTAAITIVTIISNERTTELKLACINQGGVWTHSTCAWSNGDSPK